MPDTTPPTTPPATEEAVALRSRLSRDRLARLVVVGSFLTIFLLVSALLVIAQGGNSNATNMAEKTFNTILPVLAGWVGSVIAFYFSAQSLERTSATLDRAIGQGPSISGGTVSKTMIPLGSIRALFDLTTRESSAITLEEVQKPFRELVEGGTVTREIFVKNGRFLYALHGSTLNAFLVRTGPPGDRRLSDLLADGEVLRQISKLVAFVPVSATLAEAKTALDSVTGAQDIIVTGTGKPDEPMLGWITNVDLIKGLTPS